MVKKTRKLKGGYRRIRINSGTKNIVGREGDLIAENKITGKYLVVIDGKQLYINKEQFTILNAGPSRGDQPCSHCGKVPQRTKNATMYEGVNPKNYNRGLQLDTDQYIIVKKNIPVQTYAITTCSAITFIINNKYRFFGHFSSMTDLRPI